MNVKPKCNSLIHVLAFDTAFITEDERACTLKWWRLCITITLSDWDQVILIITNISVVPWFHVLVSFTNMIMHNFMWMRTELLTTFSPVVCDCFCKTCKSGNMAQFTLINVIPNYVTSFNDPRNQSLSLFRQNNVTIGACALIPTLFFFSPFHVLYMYLQNCSWQGFGFMVWCAEL